MAKYWLIRLVWGSLLLAPVGALAQASAVPPIAYQTRTLANGLRIYSIRDPDSANVSVQVWYDVGSRDDPRDRSGFAHLFEHMMFKASRNLVPEQFDRLTEDVGGFNNASTNDDYTNYYETVPANHLERLLWAEAERMSSLVIEPSFFNSERDVVKEELRSRVLAAPYGRLFYLYLPQISYDRDPYGRAGIGSIADLDAATIEDVRAFHATYYRPDNAVLFVAGNFDEAQLRSWVDRYFGPIERPTAAIPRVQIHEPDRSEARRYTVYEPNTPLPAVLLSYPVPPASDPDAAAMEVLDGILSTGESSRLHRTLVYRDRIAAQASSFVDVRRGRGNLAVFAILSQGQSAEAGEAALRREVARFRDEPVTAAELAEAQNELITGELRERETVEGRAQALAEAVLLAGDPGAADQRLARIAAVTPADIQRVARRWLAETRSAAVRYLPEEGQNGAREDTIATAQTVETAPLVTPPNVRVWERATEAERVQPPAAGPEIAPAIPAPNRQQLANGMTVITITNRRLPIVTAGLVARGGSATDPEGRAGTAVLTAAVMTEGTRTRSASQIDQEAEELGASLDSSAGWDGASLAMTIRTAETDRAIGLIADIARNATLPDEEIERQRQTARDAVQVAMSDPGEVASLAAARAVYALSPYGHPPGGTAASLGAITRADIERAYRGQWRPANATLILTGDIDPPAARRLAEAHFGDWTGTPAVDVPTVQTRRTPRAPEVIVIDMPGAGQAAVAVARETIARRDPAFYRAIVVNAVLGGGYSARLNQEIRIRRGLSYGSGSNLDAREEPGPFVATTQTRNDAAAEVLGLILTEMRRLGAEPIPAAELVARRASLTGDFGRNAETTAGVASQLASYVTRGIDPTEIERYIPSVLAVTPAEAQATAGALLAPDGATMVIVGQADQFVGRLRAAGRTVTVIPLAQLDLNQADLR